MVLQNWTAAFEYQTASIPKTFASRASLFHVLTLRLVSNNRANGIDHLKSQNRTAAFSVRFLDVISIPKTPTLEKIVVLQGWQHSVPNGIDVCKIRTNTSTTKTLWPSTDQHSVHRREGTLTMTYAYNTTPAEYQCIGSAKC
jgi:hypothetical protein